jgi:hypothetical protein
MDMAPAAAEVAVETRAVVEAACMQQYAAGAAWVRQQAACVCAAAGSGSQGNNCNGQQAASVHAAAGSRCSVHAAAGRSGREHDCNGRQ